VDSKKLTHSLKEKKMFKCKHPNNIQLCNEVNEALADIFEIDNSRLSPELANLRSDATPVSEILKKLEKKEKAVSNASAAKSRKAELSEMHANEIIPILTIEEESRRSRCEEAFYNLLVKWGVYEPITEDDILDYAK
jgi:hypothetical protein